MCSNQLLTGEMPSSPRLKVDTIDAAMTALLQQRAGVRLGLWRFPAARYCSTRAAPGPSCCKE